MEVEDKGTQEDHPTPVEGGVADRKDLGDRLRESRKRRGWTQREASERVEISKESIEGYENGRERPPFERIVKMAKVYGVSLDYLAGSTGDYSGLPRGRHIVDRLRQ